MSRDTAATLRPVHDQHFAKALCRQVDPEVFFPSPYDKPTAEKAKAICQRCDHMLECWVLAIRERIDEGIWGGATPSERRAYWKRLSA